MWLFHYSFREDVLGTADESPGFFDEGEDRDLSAGLGFSGTRWDLAGLAGNIIDMIRNNKALAKYDEAAGRMSKGAVFADPATPRDLWSSPSLSAVAVLHRPPGPGDQYLRRLAAHQLGVRRLTRDLGHPDRFFCRKIAGVGYDPTPFMPQSYIPLALNAKYWC